MLQEMNEQLHIQQTLIEGIEQMIAEMTFITEQGDIDFVPASDEEKSKWGNPITKSLGDSAIRQKSDARRPRTGDIITSMRGDQQVNLIITGSSRGMVNVVNLKDKNAKIPAIDIKLLDMGKESEKYKRGQTAQAVGAKIDDEGGEQANVRVFTLANDDSMTL